jgi:hypothetical protein
MGRIRPKSSIRRPATQFCPLEQYPPNPDIWWLMFSRSSLSPARTLGHALKICLWHWLAIVIFLVAMLAITIVEQPRGQVHFHSHFYIVTYLCVLTLSACLASIDLGQRKFPTAISTLSVDIA